MSSFMWMFYACFMHIGANSATAECIDEVIAECGVPWDNCVGLSVDNTSVNLGKRNSQMIRIRRKNPSVYVMGCPCHIVHNMAGKGARQVNKINVIHC